MPRTDEHVPVIAARPRVAALTCLAFCAFVIVWCIARVLLVPNHFSVWYYGDAQMFNAGEHFAHEGYLANYVLPLINPGDPHSFIANNGLNGRYAHYPALHAIVNGAGIFLAERFGVRDVVPIKQMLQIFYLLVVAAGFFFYFRALQSIYGATIAALFTAFLAISPWVTGFGDSLCDQPMNIALFGVFLFLVTTQCHHKTLPPWSPLTALTCFAVSRNTIELVPVLVAFAALYVFITGFSTHRSLWYSARYCIGSVIAPMVLGIALQLYQAYLDSGSAQNFQAYWNSVFQILTQRQFSHSGIAAFLLDLPLVSLLLALLIVLSAIDVRSVLADRTYADARKVPQAAFALSFGLAMLAFPIVLPDQAHRMRQYDTAYLYLPAFLLAIVGLRAAARAPRSLLTRRSAGELYRALLGTVTVVVLLATITTQGVAALLNPSDIANYFSQPRIRALIDDQTKPTDLLLFPAAFRTNSAFEVSALVEFYLQRHGVPWGSEQDLELICATVKSDEARIAPVYPAYVPPKLYFYLPPEPGAADPALREYRCP